MVSCSECGLLYAITGNGQPVPGIYHNLRERPIGSPGGWEPRCGANAVDLAGPYRAVAKGNHSPEADIWRTAWESVVLDTKRPECESSAVFVKWVPGLGLAKHQEILDRQRLLEWQSEQRKEQRDWEQARFDEIKRREDDRDAQMRTREDTRDEAARGRHRDSMWILGGLIAIATVSAAVIAVIGQAAFGGDQNGPVANTTSLVAGTATPLPPPTE